MMIPLSNFLENDYFHLIARSGWSSRAAKQKNKLNNAYFAHLASFIQRKVRTLWGRVMFSSYTALKLVTEIWIKLL